MDREGCAHMAQAAAPPRPNSRLDSEESFRTSRSADSPCLGARPQQVNCNFNEIFTVLPESISVQSGSGSPLFCAVKGRNNFNVLFVLGSGC